MKEDIKKLLKYLLEQPEANSRFVFLLHGVASAVGMMIVCVAYAIPKFVGRELGPDMIMALASVTGVAALGRWATKRVGPQNGGPDAKS